MPTDPLTSDSPAPPSAPATGPATAPASEARSGDGEIPAGTLSAERLRKVLGRLASGFHARPEVHDRIARGLAEDGEV